MVESAAGLETVISEIYLKANAGEFGITRPQWDTLLH